MIGKVIIGKSFRGCIAYCLEDKVLKEGQTAGYVKPCRSAPLSPVFWE
jgi:hypothetical protein